MKGREIVNHIVREKMPDKEKVREDCHKQFTPQSVHGKNPQNSMRMKRLFPVAAALVLLLAISTTVFAAFGGFDEFMQRFNPPFAEVVEPVMAYDEDEGIRLTVIGAQNFNNMAVVYMSVQDVSGQNRLTESMDFRDGFWVDMEDEGTGSFGFGRTTNLLHFDEATNTAYLEMLIDADTNISDPLTIRTFLIGFEEERLEHVPIALTLTDIGEAVTIPVISREYISGMSSGFGLDGISDPEELLLPGLISNMPHTGSQWISNMGMVDGQFRLQAIREAGEFGASGSSFFLLSPDYDIVQSAFAIHAWTDESFALVSLSQYLDAYGQSPPYRLDEFVFDVDVSNMGDLTLLFTGSVTRGIVGNWRITANIADAEIQTIAFTNDVWIDGNLYEFITISPLGLQAVGSFTANREPTPEVIYVETSSDLIALRSAGGTFGGGSFRLNWQAESPIDISEVTAIVIGGHRIMP